MWACNSPLHHLTRTNRIYFLGSGFGLVRKANLSVPLVVPGCQYDIIRRKRGNLGVALQIDLFDANGSLNRAAQVSSNGAHHDAVTHDS